MQPLIVNLILVDVSKLNLWINQVKINLKLNNNNKTLITRFLLPSVDVCLHIYIVD